MNLTKPLSGIKAGLRRLYFGWQHWMIARTIRVRPNIYSIYGINLIGYSRANLGLGEALRYLAQSLVSISYPFLVRKLFPKLRAAQSNLSLIAYEEPFCAYPINCIVINPDQLRRLPSWLEKEEWTQRYNIAYWFWELEQFPAEWNYALPMMDEIWVNTEFNAKTMRAVHPCVTKIPFAIEFALPSARFDRAYFGLPERSTLFLCSFDFHSSVERKNPAASIEAFLLAFPDLSTPVNLLIKSSNGAAYPEQWRALKVLAEQDRRILFLDRHLDTEEHQGLLQCADCFVSLHRSEGLGLGLAESMYLGKPVIATNYSGNLEFMNSSNACLVDFELTAVLKTQYPHSANQVWAQANTQDAASFMQALYNDQQLRKQLGKQARSDMLSYHSYQVMGKAIVKRLEQLELKLR